MAEFVELRTEERMLLLENLEKLRIFEKHEIKCILKKLKEHENKIQRMSKCKDDYMQYIQYEMDFLQLLRLRKKKFEMGAEVSDIEHAIALDINKHFNQTVIRFPDYNIYKSYIKFCKLMGFASTLSRTLSHMVSVQSGNPVPWIIAARWELEENNNADVARKYLLQGIRYNPDSQILHKEAFRLELMYIDAKRKQIDISEVCSDRIFQIEQSDDTGQNLVACSNQGPSRQSKELEQSSILNTGKSVQKNELDDPIHQGRLAELIYESASKKINDLTFYIELLEIAKGFSFTHHLQQKLAFDILGRFQTDEQAWDVFARLMLEGHMKLECSQSESKLHVSGVNEVLEENCTISVDNRASLKTRISNCCSVYSKAVEELPTQHMWSLYIETLLDLNQDSTHLPKFKKKLLRIAFQEAHAAELLQEKYYLQWMKLTQQKSKAFTILKCATNRFPLSVELWEKRLQLHLSENEESSAVVFKEAISAFGNNSNAALPLWEMYIKYCQTKSSAEVEEIFQDGIFKVNVVAYYLKPMYIEWLAHVKGIACARKIYNDISILPPFCYEVHDKMISLECMQPQINLKQIRKCYELACEQFGVDSIGIWTSYIKFEKEMGDPLKMPGIQRKAVHKLNSSLLETFLKEYIPIVNSPPEESVEMT